MALLVGGGLALCASEARAGLEVATAAGDRLELREDGHALGVVSLSTPRAARGAARVREVGIGGRRVVELRVPVTGKPVSEVWVAELTAQGPAPIWTGLAGPMDSDGETALDVSVEPAGVTVYQTASRIVRCDGERARLYPRRYDFEARKLRDAPLPVPPRAAETVVAHRGGSGMPEGRPRVRFPFTGASSSASAAGDARALVAPLALNDGAPETVWAEGGAGDGRGEFVTARAGADGAAVTGLRITPGDTRSREAFRAHGRPRALTVVLGPAPEQRFDVTLAEDDPAAGAGYRRPYWVALPRPVRSSCVTVIVREVAPGAGSRERDTTVLGDIDVFTDLDGAQGIDRLVQALGGEECEARVADVVALGPPVLPSVASALAQTSRSARGCLVDALARIVASAAPAGAEGSAVAAVLPAALKDASDDEERKLLAVLSRLPAPPVAALAAMLGDQALGAEDRMRAARALRVLEGGEARAALVAAAGDGDAPLRATVRTLLAASGAGTAAAVRAAFEACPREAQGRRADLLLALGGLAASEPAERPAIHQVLAAALAAPEEAFEVKARAVQALGGLEDEEAGARLAELRASSPDAVLRALATRELGESPAPLALPALRAAVDDSDPAVREAAVRAIGLRKDRAATALLVSGAKQEPWPSVRRAEIAALGKLCGPQASDLFMRALERDVDEVRRAALVGMVGCHDGRAPQVLLRLVGRAPEPPSMRTLAANLLAEMRDRGTAQELQAALGRVTVESQADLALEGVAIAAVRALAAIGGPAAVEAALTLRADPRPTLKRAALEALGRLCDPRGAEALRQSARDPDPSVAAAAAAGLRRCGGSAAGAPRGAP
jgi:HEAT repeat protein